MQTINSQLTLNRSANHHMNISMERCSVLFERKETNRVNSLLVMHLLSIEWKLTFYFFVISRASNALSKMMQQVFCTIIARSFCVGNEFACYFMAHTTQILCMWIFLNASMCLSVCLLVVVAKKVSHLILLINFSFCYFFLIWLFFSHSVNEFLILLMNFSFR